MVFYVKCVSLCVYSTTLGVLSIITMAVITRCSAERLSRNAFALLPPTLLWRLTSTPALLNILCDREFLIHSFLFCFAQNNL
uniref:Putative secreted protein n=1 Tax=Anopheles darlingi TaxID=43151 RepID=A0A2M4DHE5_ANODA